RCRLFGRGHGCQHELWNVGIAMAARKRNPRCICGPPALAERVQGDAGPVGCGGQPPPCGELLPYTPVYGRTGAPGDTHGALGSDSFRTFCCTPQSTPYSKERTPTRHGMRHRITVSDSAGKRYSNRAVAARNFASTGTTRSGSAKLLVTSGSPARRVSVSVQTVASWPCSPNAD